MAACGVSASSIDWRFGVGLHRQPDHAERSGGRQWYREPTTDCFQTCATPRLSKATRPHLLSTPTVAAGSAGSAGSLSLPGSGGRNKDAKARARSRVTRGCLVIRRPMRCLSGATTAVVAIHASAAPNQTRALRAPVLCGRAAVLLCVSSPVPITTNIGLTWNFQRCGYLSPPIVELALQVRADWLARMGAKGTGMACASGFLLIPYQIV